jgi:TolB-like protein
MMMIFQITAVMMINFQKNKYLKREIEMKLGNKIFISLFLIVFLSCSTTQSNKTTNGIPEKTSTKKIIAIMPMVIYKPIDISLADLAVKYLEQEFKSYQEYEIIDRTDSAKTVDEISYSQTGIIDESTAPQIGKQLSAKYLLLSSIAQNGKYFIISARIVEVETGKVINTAVGKVTVQEKIDGAARGCARRLTGRMK